MSKTKRCLHAAVLGMLVLGIIIAGSSCKDKSKGSGASPAKCLFAIQVNNFEYTLSQMDQFLMGVSPMPMGLQMLVRMQLAGLLGNPELPGLNMNGSFTAFGVVLPGESDETKPASRVLLAGLVPVTDYDKFISGNPACSSPDDDGVSTITVSAPTIPGATAAQPPAESPGGPKMVAVKLGGFALITSQGQRAKLVQYKDMMASQAGGSAAATQLASISDSALAQQASKEPIWIYGNIQTASKMFAPFLFDKIEEMETTITDMPATMQTSIEQLEESRDKMAEADVDKATIDQIDSQIQMLKNQQNTMASSFQSTETVSKMVDMYVGILKTMVNETESLTLAIKPTPKVLLITKTVSAIPGTDMAEMFTAGDSSDVENDLLGYLEDGSAMNFAFKMDTPFWGKLHAKGMDLIAGIAGEAVSAEDLAKMKALAADSMDAFGGPGAGTFIVDAESKPPFAIKYVIAVKDVDKFNKVIDESTEMFKTTGITEFYKSFGMEFDYVLKRGVDTYKGVSIDSAGLVIKSTEPNSPGGQIIDTMYGEGFDYRWGVADGICAVAIGGDVDSVVRELIDQVKAGGQKEICNEVKDALEMLPGAEKADFFATYNYVRLFGMIGAMMPTLPGAAPGMTMPKIDVPSKSNLNFAGKVGDGKIRIDIAIPKQHLTELVGAFMMLQQEIQKQQSPISTKATLKTLQTALELFMLDTGRYPT